MIRAFSAIALVPLVLLLPAGTGAQQTMPKEVHEEIVVDLVDVYLTALDSKGAFVTNLRPEELVLTEDGVPQEITHFALSEESTEEPLNVVILIDTSVSMNERYKQKSKLKMAKDGALLLLHQLKAGDSIMLMTFSNKPVEAIPLTSDVKAMEAGISALTTDYGRTALLDAMLAVTEKMTGVFGRKVVFICSDGQDNASVNKAEKVLNRLKESPDMMTITLGITSFESSTHWIGQEQEEAEGEKLLQSLADTSGGYAFFPKNMNDLDHVMEKLQRVVPSQYSLAYHSTNPNLDGLWRTIELQCKRKGVKLRYRTGYFAK